MITRLFQLNKTSLFLLAVLTCSFVVILTPDFSSAAIKSFTVSPLRTELEVAPGTSQGGTLSVTNSTEKSITVNLEANEFSVINQQYDYAFNSESDITKWVSFDSTVIYLQPNQTKQVKFTIGVPLSAEPGGRYFSLFISTDNDSTNNGVITRQRVASLVYLTVTGDLTRSGSLISLASPWLVVDAAQWSAVLRNSGTTHYHSRYSSEVLDLFGQKASVQAKDESLILPGTVRLVSDKLVLPLWPGIYKVKYMIGLGDNPAVIKTRLMIYVPPLAITVICALIIVFWSRIIIRRLKKH